MKNQIAAVALQGFWCMAVAPVYAQLTSTQVAELKQFRGVDLMAEQERNT